MRIEHDKPILPGYIAVLTAPISDENDPALAILLKEARLKPDDVILNITEFANQRRTFVYRRQ